MGIPSYFRFILEEYNDKDELILSKIERNNKTINIDYLCIDFNSIIYTVYAKKKQEIDKIATSRIEIMNLLIEKIVEEMKYIIDFIGPRKKTLLAFDGIAPFAKVHQQRSRRYKSVLYDSIVEKHFFSDKKGQKCPKKKFNLSFHACPGTLFMSKLATQLREALCVEKKEDTSSDNNNLVIISDSEEKGEGEHKIKNFITNSKIGLNDTCVVMSPDNDMISLSILTGKENIFLMRYKDEYTMKTFPFLKSNEIQFFFLNINRIKEQFLYNERALLTNESEGEKLLRDYNFCLSIVGNDFIKSLPYLKIKNNGLNTLLQYYRNIKLSNPRFKKAYLIIQENTEKKGCFRLNFDFFLEIISKLMKDEMRELNNYANFIERQRTSRTIKQSIDSNDKLTQREKFEEKLQHCYIFNEYHPLYEDYIEKFESVYSVNKTKNVISLVAHNEFKKRFYKHFLSEQQQQYQEKRDQMIIDYLKSLIFCFKYYNNNKEYYPDTSFYYKYRTAPLFSDVYNFLIKKKNNTTFWKNLHLDFEEITRPIATVKTTLEQLFCILPREGIIEVFGNDSTNSNSNHYLKIMNQFSKLNFPSVHTIEIDVVEGGKFIYSEAILPQHKNLSLMFSALKKNTAAR